MMFYIYPALGIHYIYSNNGFMNCHNAWVNYDEKIMPGYCPWGAVHRQICLICTSIPLFSQLDDVTNIICKVVRTPMNKDQDDWEAWEVDRDISFSILPEIFSDKRGNFVKLTARSSTPVSPAPLEGESRRFLDA